MIEFKHSFTFLFKITRIRFNFTENQLDMRVARRDVRIVIANEIALQRDINYPRGSFKSNNKLLRPVIGSAHIQGKFTLKKYLK